MKTANLTHPLKEQIIDKIRTVYDPEIPVNIYELGLIYEVQVDDEHLVNIRMTLTSPNCPEAESLPSEVEDRVRELDGINGVRVEVVWEPPWTPDKMSEEAKLELNMF